MATGIYFGVGDIVQNCIDLLLSSSELSAKTSTGAYGVANIHSQSSQLSTETIDERKLLRYR